MTDWFAGERPLTLWTGQQLNVHGQAQVVLRRRAMENLLIVGENQPAAFGMLIAALCSVPINERPARRLQQLVRTIVPVQTASSTSCSGSFSAVRMSRMRWMRKTTLRSPSRVTLAWPEIVEPAP